FGGTRLPANWTENIHAVCIKKHQNYQTNLICQVTHRQRLSNQPAKHKRSKSPIGRVGDGRISSHFLWMSATPPLQPTPFPDAALPREPMEVRGGGATVFVLPVERVSRRNLASIRRFATS